MDEIWTREQLNGLMPDHIQEVFDFTIGEISSIFSLTREEAAQLLSTYDAPLEQSSLLYRFYQLARLIKKHGLNKSYARNLLRMRAGEDGKTLLEIMLDDHNGWYTIAYQLVIEAEAARKSYEQSHLSQSKAEPTNDWQTEISIPATLER